MYTKFQTKMAAPQLLALCENALPYQIILEYDDNKLHFIIFLELCKITLIFPFIM